MMADATRRGVQTVIACVAIGKGQGGGVPTRPSTASQSNSPFATPSIFSEPIVVSPADSVLESDRGDPRGVTRANAALPQTEPKNHRSTRDKTVRPPRRDAVVPMNRGNPSCVYVR